MRINEILQAPGTWTNETGQPVSIDPPGVMIQRGESLTLDYTGNITVVGKDVTPRDPILEPPAPPTGGGEQGADVMAREPETPAEPVVESDGQPAAADLVTDIEQPAKSKGKK